MQLTPEEYQATLIEFNHQVFFTDDFISLNSFITTKIMNKIFNEKKNSFIDLNNYPDVKNGLIDIRSRNLTAMMKKDRTVF